MELEWNLKSFHYFAPFVILQASRILETVALGRGMFSFRKGYGAVTGVDIDKSPVYFARSFSQGHGADNT